MFLPELPTEQFDWGQVATTCIKLHAEASQPVLALGAELKSSVCVLAGREAVFTEHLGDLAEPGTYRKFLATVEALQKKLGVKPAIVACDLHPSYAATRYAHSLNMKTIGVQHHHAHVVACMAEHELTGQVVGLCCDGTGYGLDGSIWGCEVLVCDNAAFRRAGHLRTFPLIGGDAASLETWRPAVGLLHEIFGDLNAEKLTASCLNRVDQKALELMQSRLKTGRALRTSSLGRLFDAVAFLLDICDRNITEAAAPMALEAAAGNCDFAEPFDFEIQPGQAFEMDYRPMIRGLLEGLKAGQSQEALARAFHETLAAMLADCVTRVAEQAGLDRVALSGGCFMNRILTKRLKELLDAAGLKVFYHTRIPTSDVSISLGQAISASARLGQEG